MTVYVDNVFLQASVPNGGRTVTSRWCHLFTDQDDPTELHEFAQRIGLRREWFQEGRMLGDRSRPDPTKDHYDVTASRRRAAVAAGAVEISYREAGEMRRKRRLAARGVTPDDAA
jgi:hypothetical protein